MTRKQLEAAYIAQAVRSLNKSSRFYADDKAAIRAHATRKTVKELRESIGRLGAVDQVSQSEINTHCQFAGL